MFPLLPGTRDPFGFLQTGFGDLDRLLGGGLPRGGIVELFGPPDSGKTTMAYCWLAAAQQAGATVVYTDVEGLFHPERASQCGINLEEMVLLRPEHGPRAVGMLDTLLRTFTIDLVVVDSVAALVSDRELEMSLEETPDSAHTGFLERALNRLQLLARRSYASLVFLNQARQFSNEGAITSAGGPALPLRASVRLRLERERAQQVRVVAVKNRFGEAHASVWVDVDSRGIPVPARRTTRRTGASRSPDAASEGG